MTMTEALSHVREGFSPRLIKQAIGIASDKRYAGGNMSGAVDAIEKLQKGLSDHPQVMAVLKRQNEDVDMQEGRMKELHHHIKMGKSAKEIAKIMKLDFKTINALVDGLTYEEFEERKERYERVMSPYRSKGTESLDEAFSSWTVTILKTVNKIKKGDSKSVKAQNVAQALKKAAKAWGDDNLNSMPSTAFKVTKDTSESVEEGTESLDEKYDLYHKTFSGAMQHSYEYAKKKFKIEIDPTEIDDKVAMGPPKPKNGKTNSYRLKGTNGKGIQVQVYNTGTSFELNMYKESVDDVNEDKRADDKKRTAKELSKKDFVKAYTWGMDDKISKKDFVKKHGTEKDVASYWDSMNESVEIDEAISGDQYYYVDPKGVVAAVGNKDSMRKMNMKQAKDGNKGGSFSQNLKKYKVGDKIKESVEIDEASKEGTIRIIDLGNRNQDKIRKDLGVDKLGDSGFQVQVMTKGKFVNVGKPYKTMKDAEKVRKSGQHSLPLEMFNNKGAKHAKNEDIDQNRDDTKTTRIAQLNLQIAKAKQTINKLNDKET